MLPLKTCPVLVLCLGLWIGSSAAMLAVVAYNFIGIPRAVSANDALRARAGLEPDANREERRQSVLFVFAGELNRSLLWGFNRVQVVLAAVTLAAALLGRTRRIVSISALASLVIVATLTFWLAPRIESIGRTLDFVPRAAGTQAESSFAAFDRLHRIYTSAEGAKVALLLVALAFQLRPAKASDRA
jgi:hypothetical protein